ncbi:MAG: tetratricopeptide repeat protein [Chloroflexota bacterium]
MSWWVPRTAFALLTVLTLVGFFLLLQAVKITGIFIGRPPALVLLDPRTDRPMQALYQLEAQAARAGWTPENRRLAGDLWRSAGDLTQAVAYWETAEPTAPVLRDLAQAYIELQRWSNAESALQRLLPLLPPGASDRSWAQFQLGLIRAAYNPASARDLLRAAQPAYGDSVTTLLPLLEATDDPTRIGIALANAGLWSYAELAFSAAADPLASAYAGLARDMQGKDGGAWIENALAFAPENPQVYFLHGLHLRLKFDFAGSLQAITQAVALDPENPALYAELGRAYQLSGDLVSAERWLKFAVTLDDNFQTLLDSFYEDEATLLRDMGLMDEASLPFDATLSPER